MRAKPVIAPSFNLFDRWDLPPTGFATTHVTATAATAGNPVENLLDPRRYLYYQADSTTTCFIKVVMTGDGGIPVPVGWDGPTVWGLGAVTGFAGRSVTVDLEGSNDDISYDPIDSFTKNDDYDVARFIASGYDYDYYRITLTWSDAQAAPKIGWLVTGEFLEFERYPEDGYDPYRRTPKAYLESSREGQFLGWTSLYEKLNTSFRFDNLTTDFAEEFSDWWQANLGLTFWFIWDRAEHPLDVFHVTLDPQWDRDLPYGPADLHTLSLDMFGIFPRR